MKTKTTKTGLQAALLAGSIFISSSIASQAAVYTWTSNSDTDWTNGANWSGGTAPTSLSNTTDWQVPASPLDTIVFSGTVMPVSNIPSYDGFLDFGGGPGNITNDTIPMIINSGGTLTLDFSTNFNSSMWAMGSRTQLTVGDGINAVTLNINNMSSFARNDVESTYVVNAGSLLNINGNLNEYGDNGAKEGVFNLNGGSMVVDGIATGGGTLDFDDNTTFNFSGIGSSLTMDFGGTYYNSLTDVTGDFGTVFNGAIKAIDNGNGTFTVAVPEPSSTALLGLGGVALLLRRRRA